MVEPSAFAVTVTPPIFSPAADFTAPVNKTPFDAACSVFGTQIPAATPNDTTIPRIIHNFRADFIAPPAAASSALIYGPLPPSSEGRLTYKIANSYPRCLQCTYWRGLPHTDQPLTYLLATGAAK